MARLSIVLVMVAAGALLVVDVAADGPEDMRLTREQFHDLAKWVAVRARSCGRGVQRRTVANGGAFTPVALRAVIMEWVLAQRPKTETPSMLTIPFSSIIGHRQKSSPLSTVRRRCTTDDCRINDRAHSSAFCSATRATDAQRRPPMTRPSSDNLAHTCPT